MTKMLKDLKQNLKDGKMLKRVQHDTRVGRALAFTLAEVLIVIGIIGVVAALTLPNLNHATGDKEKVTRVKKAYSALTEAVDRAQAIYGPFNTWFNDNSTRAEKSERFAKRVTEFLKISKDCGFDDGCWAAAPYIDALGNDYTENDTYLDDLKSYNTYMVTLSDGMSLGFEGNNAMDRIRVDIDGPKKGKNQEGNDIFDFSIYLDNDTASLRGTEVNILYPDNKFVMADSNIFYVTSWVIQNGNLDYLKVTKVGGGKGKQTKYLCPNGVELSWSNPSCN